MAVTRSEFKLKAVLEIQLSGGYCLSSPYNSANTTNITPRMNIGSKKQIMENITSETTVGEIVRVLPNRARIFENLGIDYCCGGKKPLGEVCRGKGLDPATVIAMLAALDGAPDSSTTDPDAMSLSELCDHIERAHHDYLREELPRLDFMTRKVAAVHGDHETRLLEVRTVFETF